MCVCLQIYPHICICEMYVLMKGEGGGGRLNAELGAIRLCCLGQKVHTTQHMREYKNRGERKLKTKKF